jgi:hypothetical protein
MAPLSPLGWLSCACKDGQSVFTSRRRSNFEGLGEVNMIFPTSLTLPLKVCCQLQTQKDIAVLNVLMTKKLEYLFIFPKP